VAETGGGALLVLGAATPLAAAAITGTMTVAIHKVHLQKGPWATDGGYEYNAVLMAAVFAITAEGPGAFALDRRRWGTGWAIAELVAGAGGALAMVKFSDRQAEVDPHGSARFTQPAPTTEAANA
jgi:putative oxidoreductase